MQLMQQKKQMQHQTSNAFEVLRVSEKCLHCIWYYTGLHAPTRLKNVQWTWHYKLHKQIALSDLSFDNECFLQSRVEYNFNGEQETSHQLVLVPVLVGEYEEVISSGKSCGGNGRLGNVQSDPWIIRTETGLWVHSEPGICQETCHRSGGEGRVKGFVCVQCGYHSYKHEQVRKGCARHPW